MINNGKTGAILFGEQSPWATTEGTIQEAFKLSKEYSLKKEYNKAVCILRIAHGAALKDKNSMLPYAGHDLAAALMFRSAARGNEHDFLEALDIFKRYLDSTEGMLKAARRRKSAPEDIMTLEKTKVILLTSMGELYSALDRNQQAIDSYRSAYEIADTVSRATRKHHDLRVDNILLGIIVNSMFVGQYDEAEKYLNIGRGFFKAEDEALALSLFARVNVLNKNAKAALEYAKRARAKFLSKELIEGQAYFIELAPTMAMALADQSGHEEALRFIEEVRAELDAKTRFDSEEKDNALEKLETVICNLIQFYFPFDEGINTSLSHIVEVNDAGLQFNSLLTERARLCVVKGRLDEAISLLKQAHQARPHDTDILLELARALCRRSGDDDLVAAENFAKAVIRLNPNAGNSVNFVFANINIIKSQRKEQAQKSVCLRQAQQQLQKVENLPCNNSDFYILVSLAYATQDAANVFLQWLPQKNRFFPYYFLQSMKYFNLDEQAIENIKAILDGIDKNSSAHPRARALAEEILQKLNGSPDASKTSADSGEDQEGADEEKVSRELERVRAAAFREDAIRNMLKLEDIDAAQALFDDSTGILPDGKHAMLEEEIKDVKSCRDTQGKQGETIDSEEERAEYYRKTATRFGEEEEIYKAVYLIRKAVAIEPQNPACLYVLAKALTERAQTTGYKKDYDEAYSIACSAVDIIDGELKAISAEKDRRRKDPKALRILGTYETNFKKGKAMQLALLGKICFQSDRNEEAAVYYRQAKNTAQEVSEDFPLSYLFNFGACCLQIGLTDEAVSCFEEILAKGGELHMEALVNHTRACFRQADRDNTMRYYRQSSDEVGLIDTMRIAYAYFFSAVSAALCTQTSEGNVEQAAEILRQARERLKASPLSPEQKLEMEAGLEIAYVDSIRYAAIITEEEAKRLITYINGLRPELASGAVSNLRIPLSQLYVVSGDVDKAVEVLYSAREENPEETDTLICLAGTLCRRGTGRDSQTADKLLEIALTLDSFEAERAEYIRGLKCFFRSRMAENEAQAQNELKQAIMHFEEAKRLGFNDEYFLIAAGIALAGSNRQPEAIKMFTERLNRQILMLPHQFSHAIKWLGLNEKETGQLISILQGVHGNRETPANIKSYVLEVLKGLGSDGAQAEPERQEEPQPSAPKEPDFMKTQKGPIASARAAAVKGNYEQALASVAEIISAFEESGKLLPRDVLEIKQAATLVAEVVRCVGEINGITEQAKKFYQAADFQNHINSLREIQNLCRRTRELLGNNKDILLNRDKRQSYIVAVNETERKTSEAIIRTDGFNTRLQTILAKAGEGSFQEAAAIAKTLYSEDKRPNEGLAGAGRLEECLRETGSAIALYQSQNWQQAQEVVRAVASGNRRLCDTNEFSEPEWMKTINRISGSIDANLGHIIECENAFAARNWQGAVSVASRVKELALANTRRNGQNGTPGVPQDAAFIRACEISALGTAIIDSPDIKRLPSEMLADANTAIENNDFDTARTLLGALDTWSNVKLPWGNPVTEPQQRAMQDLREKIDLRDETIAAYCSGDWQQVIELAEKAQAFSDKCRSNFEGLIANCNSMLACLNAFESKDWENAVQKARAVTQVLDEDSCFRVAQGIIIEAGKALEVISKAGDLLATAESAREAGNFIVVRDCFPQLNELAEAEISGAKILSAESQDRIGLIRQAATEHAETLCAQAVELYNTGDLNKARAAYVFALELEHGNSAAQEGIDHLKQTDQAMGAFYVLVDAAVSSESRLEFDKEDNLPSVIATINRLATGRSPEDLTAIRKMYGTVIDRLRNGVAELIGSADRMVKGERIQGARTLQSRLFSLLGVEVLGENLISMDSPMRREIGNLRIAIDRKQTEMRQRSRQQPPDRVRQNVGASRTEVPSEAKAVEASQPQLTPVTVIMDGAKQQIGFTDEQLALYNHILQAPDQSVLAQYNDACRMQPEPVKSALMELYRRQVSKVYKPPVVAVTASEAEPGNGKHREPGIRHYAESGEPSGSTGLNMQQLRAEMSSLKTVDDRLAFLHKIRKAYIARSISTGDALSLAGRLLDYFRSKLAQKQGSKNAGDTIISKLETGVKETQAFIELLNLSGSKPARPAGGPARALVEDLSLSAPSGRENAAPRIDYGRHQLFGESALRPAASRPGPEDEEESSSGVPADAGDLVSLEAFSGFKVPEEEWLRKRTLLNRRETEFNKIQGDDERIVESLLGLLEDALPDESGFVRNDFLQRELNKASKGEFFKHKKEIRQLIAILRGATLACLNGRDWLSGQPIAAISATESADNIIISVLDNKNVDVILYSTILIRKFMENAHMEITGKNPPAQRVFRNEDGDSVEVGALFEISPDEIQSPSLCFRLAVAYLLSGAAKLASLKGEECMGADEVTQLLCGPSPSVPGSSLFNDIVKYVYVTHLIDNIAPKRVAMVKENFGCQSNAVNTAFLETALSGSCQFNTFPEALLRTVLVSGLTENFLEIIEHAQRGGYGDAQDTTLKYLARWARKYYRETAVLAINATAPSLRVPRVNYAQSLAEACAFYPDAYVLTEALKRLAPLDGYELRIFVNGIGLLSPQAKMRLCRLINDQPKAPNGEAGGNIDEAILFSTANDLLEGSARAAMDSAENAERACNAYLSFPTENTLRHYLGLAFNEDGSADKAWLARLYSADKHTVGRTSEDLKKIAFSKKDPLKKIARITYQRLLYGRVRSNLTQLQRIKANDRQCPAACVKAAESLWLYADFIRQTEHYKQAEREYKWLSGPLQQLSQNNEQVYVSLIKNSPFLFHYGTLLFYLGAGLEKQDYLIAAVAELESYTRITSATVAEQLMSSARVLSYWLKVKEKLETGGQAGPQHKAEMTVAHVTLISLYVTNGLQRKAEEYCAKVGGYMTVSDFIDQSSHRMLLQAA